MAFASLHRSCSHVLKKKHASGATDKLPVLTESARTHVDACMHEKDRVRKLKKHLRGKKTSRPHNLINITFRNDPTAGSRITMSVLNAVLKH